MIEIKIGENNKAAYTHFEYIDDFYNEIDLEDKGEDIKNAISALLSALGMTDVAPISISIAKQSSMIDECDLKNKDLAYFDTKYFQTTKISPRFIDKMAIEYAYNPKYKAAIDKYFNLFSGKIETNNSFIGIVNYRNIVSRAFDFISRDERHRTGYNKFINGASLESDS